MNFGEIIRGPLTPFKNFNIVFIALFALVFLISFSTGDEKTASALARKLMPDILNGFITLIFIGYCINYFKTKYLLSDPEVNVNIDAGNFVKTGFKFYVFGFFLGLYSIVFLAPLLPLYGMVVGVIVWIHQIIITAVFAVLSAILTIWLFANWVKYSLVATLRYLQTDNIKEAWNIKEINSIIKLNDKTLDSYIWVAAGLFVIYIFVILCSSMFALINTLFASLLLGMAMWYSTIVFYDMYGSMLNNIVMQPQEV